MSGSFINFRTIPNLQVTDTNQSTLPTNGCATFAGGIGVAGNGLFGGSVNATTFICPTIVAGNIAFPTVGTRSQGTKFVLAPLVGTNTADIALGVAAGAFWLSVSSSANRFAFYAATSEVASISGTGVITGSQYRLSALNTAPASSSDTGQAGEIRDALSGGIYYRFLCVATNTWVRAAYATW